MRIDFTINWINLIIGVLFIFVWSLIVVVLNLPSWTIHLNWFALLIVFYRDNKQLFNNRKINNGKKRNVSK